MDEATFYNCIISHLSRFADFDEIEVASKQVFEKNERQGIRAVDGMVFCLQVLDRIRQNRFEKMTFDIYKE